MQVKDFKKTLFPEACESLKGISAIVPRYRAVHVKVNVLVFGLMINNSFKSMTRDMNMMDLQQNGMSQDGVQELCNMKWIIWMVRSTQT